MPLSGVVGIEITRGEGLREGKNITVYLAPLRKSGRCFSVKFARMERGIVVFLSFEKRTLTMSCL
jgi:hypothetical protein